MQNWVPIHFGTADKEKLGKKIRSWSVKKVTATRASSKFIDNNKNKYMLYQIYSWDSLTIHSSMMIMRSYLCISDIMYIIQSTEFVHT